MQVHNISISEQNCNDISKDLNTCGLHYPSATELRSREGEKPRPAKRVGRLWFIMRETVEEHVEDGAAHQFEEQLEELKETMEEQHEELREKMGRQVCTCLLYIHVGVKFFCVIATSFQEDMKSSLLEEEEEDDGGWIFGSAPPRQVQLQDLPPKFSPTPPLPVLAQVDSEKVDVDVAEHLHQAYRLVSIF